MSQFRVTKPSLPSRSSTYRRLRLGLAVEAEDNRSMAPCSHCRSSDEVCFFSEELSTRCARCLTKNLKCDGSFSLSEFKSVLEQKKQISARSKQKREEIARHSAAVASLVASLS